MEKTKITSKKIKDRCIISPKLQDQDITAINIKKETGLNLKWIVLVAIFTTLIE